MDREKALKILELLRKEYGNVGGTVLRFETPLDLLVATMLAAQCTDERVNQVTEHLFKKYRTAEDYANADLEELEQEIRPTGFYKNKAKAIKKMAKVLVERYNSQVPKSLEELVKLPGVARKTANIVLSNAYGINEGIAVDTHVMRLAQRMGFTSEKNRDKIERDLMNLFPKEDWFEMTNLLITHGRRVCTARKPKCGDCVVNKLCPSAFKV
ncbi:MAG: endonuclease III [Candidatus Freyrarchaeum guaymaensis]|nr:endonuclease III [Candidatus Freyarchaeota archaeon]MDO8091246.1 endonuclease III [Candidatus Sigynarchaeota archaeon]